jgi:uroporphyrinogen decarboxylase
MLSHRERVLMTLKHQEPDRVPIDLGATDATSIMVRPYRLLRNQLGLENRPIRVIDPMQQCVWLDKDVQSVLGIDVIGIPFLPCAWRDDHAYDGQPAQYPLNFRPETLADGSRVILTSKGEIDWRMPAGGFYFDQVYHPLANMSSLDEIDQALGVIQNFDRPSWLDMSYEQIADHAKSVRETTDAVLIGQFSGHIFQAGQFLRGWEKFMIDLLVSPSLAEGIMDRLADGHMRAFERYANTVGRYVDIIQVNDDLGTQNNLWISPELYRQRIKPYHAKLYSFIKSKCNAYLWLHSDGAIAPLIPDLIEMGVDILNPIQYTAAGMNCRELKRNFGSDISFWGGGIDTQRVLPFGSVDEVVDAVRHQIDEMAPGGGYVFATVHNIQDGVPTENILATFETAANYGHY